jgi:hypothetical protein
MRRQSLADEAQACRMLANEFTGKLERPFLLDAAVLFEELSGERSAASRNGRGASDHFLFGHER